MFHYETSKSDQCYDLIGGGKKQNVCNGELYNFEFLQACNKNLLIMLQLNISLKQAEHSKSHTFSNMSS